MSVQTTDNFAPALRYRYGRRRKMGEGIVPQMPKGMGKPMLKVMRGKMTRRMM